MEEHTKSIRLRALEPGDVDLLYLWENDPSIWHLSNTSIPFSRFDIEQYVFNANKDIFACKQLRLMVDLCSEGEVVKAIGCVDLFGFEAMHKRAGVGILIEKHERRKGYASEAIDQITEYAFGTLNLHQVFCNIEADNLISIALFKKKKFQIIGIKKDWNLKNGKWVDVYLMQKFNQ